MTKLRCCFCQQELFYAYQQDGIIPNPNKGKVDTIFCDNCKMCGNETIWQELIRTRKALDVAVMALEEFDKNNICYGPAFEALHIIKQITETKDVKNED